MGHRSRDHTEIGRSNSSAQVPIRRLPAPLGAVYNWKDDYVRGLSPPVTYAIPASFKREPRCPVFAITDFQKIPSSGIRFLPKTTNFNGTNTYSVNH